MLLLQEEIWRHSELLNWRDSQAQVTGLHFPPSFRWIKKRQRRGKHPSSYPLLMRESNLKLFLILIQKPFSTIKLFSFVLTLFIHKLSPAASSPSPSQMGKRRSFTISKRLSKSFQYSYSLHTFEYWRKIDLPFCIHLNQNKTTYFRQD